MAILNNIRRKLELTDETFNRLLQWLDYDRDKAGAKYEEIRSRLIKMFVCRGCTAAEDLADETITRVAAKLEHLAATYNGNPVLYFYGVAQKIHFEYLRKKPAPVPVIHSATTGETERKYMCLEQCMETLSYANRELILAYYGQDTDRDESTNSEQRRRLSEKMGIGANALWIRVHRIRESLKRCVTACFATSKA